MSRDPTARDALAWMQGRASGATQFLFRGQTRTHPTVLPSLFRPDVSEADRRQWMMVMRRFVSARAGVTGYSVRSPHDAVAIVQHYLVKSPVIDLTGTPKIALYFAMMTPSCKDTRVVYAADADSIRRAGFAVTDHAFLAMPMSDGGRMHRWLRQDGFTVGMPDWTDLDGASRLDFARLPSVESFRFQSGADDEDLIELGDLETVEGDPLASKVRGVFEAIAQHLGCLEAVRGLMPKSGTIDGHAQLRNEIEALLARARAHRLKRDDIAEIERLRDAARDGYWDASWEVGLDHWTARVNSARRRW